jgi:hypothetical protein
LTAVLLSVHVLAAIMLIGPIAVATSLFPRYARAALGEPSNAGAAPGSDADARVARALHRVTRLYAVAAVAVPVFGIVAADQLRELGQAWLVIAMILTAVAALLLAVLIVPAQRTVIAVLDGTAGVSQGSSAQAAGGLSRLQPQTMRSTSIPPTRPLLRRLVHARPNRVVRWLRPTRRHRTL